MDKKNKSLDLEKSIKRDNWKRVMKIINEEIANSDYISSSYLFEIDEDEYRKDPDTMDCD